MHLPGFFAGTGVPALVVTGAYYHRARFNSSGATVGASRRAQNIFALPMPDVAATPPRVRASNYRHTETTVRCSC